MFALRQWKEWVWRRYAMFCFRLHQWLGQFAWQNLNQSAICAFRLPNHAHKAA
ncbi:hypothetical protein [Kingella sp. (in: b-proteobacteria)]|uniref:hypothetical protein n=1 Tax=Kingella sp. (in: b-proteobacteria) TaxID=2020713 RepID=UPI0026DDA810|nr:hypothetical protein [Kingella sp. (in: b-proteobacteria)]MDO4657637.1 hypothetical protein [Kingella sp. (in: b-proteobacteria)]